MEKKRQASIHETTGETQQYTQNNLVSKKVSFCNSRIQGVRFEWKTNNTQAQLAVKNVT